MAPRGTSDPAGPPAAQVPGTAPRPRALRPRLLPVRAPPRRSAHPRPAPPAPRPAPARPGASRRGGTDRRQLALGAMARRLLRPPAGSLGRPEPAVPAAAPRWGPGAGGREAAAAEAGRSALPQPRARSSLARSPALGAPAPARPASPRGHMAPLRALLSCLLPLHCALCAAAGSRTPGACGWGARGRVGPGVHAGQGAPTVPEALGSVLAGGRRCARSG